MLYPFPLVGMFPIGNVILACASGLLCPPPWTDCCAVNTGAVREYTRRTFGCIIEAANVDDALILSVLIMFATGCREDGSPGEERVYPPGLAAFSIHCVRMRWLKMLFKIVYTVFPVEPCMLSMLSKTYLYWVVEWGCCTCWKPNQSRRL